MRTAFAVVCLAFLFLASSAFAQTQPAPIPITTACGPDNVKFDVKHDNAQHFLSQPEAGKALVYVMEVFQRPPGEVGTPTIRIGLNGAWAGANQGSSYFSFSVDPGEQHLCANWQSMWKQLSSQHSFASFTAEAGKTYFFRVRVQFQTYAPGPSDSSNTVMWSIDLQPINADEGKYLISSSPLSVFHAKK